MGDESGRASAFAAKQRRVRAVIRPMIVIIAAALGGALSLAPRDAPPVATAERLARALVLDLSVLGWVLLMIGEVASRRLFSPDDIDGSAGRVESDAVRLSRAILQNTLEQAVIAVGAHLALAVLLPAWQLVLLPALAALFGLGRLLYWIGYRMSPMSRALGFAVTFVPTILAYAYAAALLIRN
jgi:hypothetical protein